MSRSEYITSDYISDHKKFYRSQIFVLRHFLAAESLEGLPSDTNIAELIFVKSLTPISLHWSKCEPVLQYSIFFYNNLSQT